MQSMGRLRHALSSVAPPLAVVLVGGLIAGAVLTGRPAVAARSVAAATPSTSTAVVTLGRFDSLALRATAPDDATDVGKALSVLGPHDERKRHAARSSRSKERAPLHHWVRPNYGPLTSGFGQRWGRLHAGIDLAGPYGSPIVAATDGCISYAGYESGYGNEVRIQDWDGTETLYGHMSEIVRHSGCVKAGQLIGYLGSTGNVTGPHLHFEIHVGGVPVNPISYLAKRHLYI
jgi:murein DD-endopeptidase MepM/ murein hydrolase activator NlpD